MLENNLGPFIHLGLPVLNISEAKAWYRDVMGYKVIHEPSLPFDGTTIHISFLQKKGIMLEFYELTSNEISEYPLRENGFIDHFTLNVNKLESATDLLTKNGAKMIDGGNCIPIRGKKSQMFKGIYGEKFLIVESKDSDHEDFIFADVGIAYSNREEVVNFYLKMGFEFIKDPNDKNIFYFGYKNVTIKFFWEPEETVRKRNDGYIDHIAFDIKNIDDVYREVESAGCLLVEDEPVELPFWDKGIKYFNFRGPSGEKVELEQRL